MALRSRRSNIEAEKRLLEKKGKRAKRRQDKIASHLIMLGQVQAVGVILLVG